MAKLSAAMLAVVGMIAVLAAAKGAAAASCQTLREIIHAELPSVAFHPVFNEIFDSPTLGNNGVFFLPTKEAWADLKATAATQGVDLGAPSMTAANGALFLHMLGQGASAVDPAKLTATTTEVKTAGHWACSSSPDSLGAKLVLRAEPGTNAPLLQHAGSNVTRTYARVALPAVMTCAGLRVYKVDAVPLPCATIAAVYAETSDPLQTGCPAELGTVAGSLLDNGGDYFYQLLTAAGLLATVDKTVAPYTIFAPSNAAVASAIASGQLDVGGLFGRDPKALRQLVAYHVHPTDNLTDPTPGSTTGLSTLVEGPLPCKASATKLTWAPDRLVRGARGAAVVRASHVACGSVVHSIDSVLFPCCATLPVLFNGDGVMSTGYASARARGANRTAAPPASAARVEFLRYIANITATQSGNATRSFIVPSPEAWAALDRAAAKANASLSKDNLQVLFSYLTASPAANLEKGLSDVAAGGKSSWATQLPTASAADRKRVCGAAPTGSTINLAPAAAPTPPTTRRLLAATGAAPADAASTGAIALLQDGLSPLMPDRKILVTGIDAACDGSNIVLTDAVPLPCNFLNFTSVPAPVAVDAAAANAATGADAAAAASGNATAAGNAAAARVAAAPLAAAAAAVLGALLF